MLQAISTALAEHHNPVGLLACIMCLALVGGAGVVVACLAIIETVRARRARAFYTPRRHRRRSRR